MLVDYLCLTTQQLHKPAEQMSQLMLERQLRGKEACLPDVAVASVLELQLF